MTLSESVRTVLREKYATFTGRASRSEYWWFTLFYVLFIIAIFILFAVTGGGSWIASMDTDMMAPLGVMSKLVMIIGLLFILAMIIPSIAVLVRRFHDRNMSGWWVLGLVVVGMIPLVGLITSIAQLVICCLKGTDGENKFGDDPLA